MMSLQRLVVVLILVGTGSLFAREVEEITGDARRVEPLPAVEVSSNDWPWWRGPTFDNVARPQSLPLRFGPKENVLWRAEVPGRGHASPIVWSNRLFVATAVDAEQTQWLLAYDRSTGRELWKTLLHRGGFMKKSHRANSHASATPACDGERVFTVFVHGGFLWVSAVSLTGEVLWQSKAGEYDALYGFGMSPALYGPLVIVCGDNDQTGAFLAALHRKTGKIVWRVRRPLIDTYATPIVVRVAGRAQLVLGGGGHVTSYDPNTGQVLWRCEGPTSETTANTAAFSRDVVFVSGGYPKPYTLLAIIADGSGDVTKTRLRWRSTKHMCYVPSPLYAAGLLYIADDFGFASCLDAANGKTLWSERLGGDVSSSPLRCDDRVYFCTEPGVVSVLRAGRTYELLAQNDMEEGIMATPVICGGRMYLRTEHKLYCIGMLAEEKPHR